MSLLVQALLGAKVDGSGLSLHADRRTRWDQDDNLPMVNEEGSTKKAGWGRTGRGDGGCRPSASGILLGRSAQEFEGVRESASRAVRLLTVPRLSDDKRRCSYLDLLQASRVAVYLFQGGLARFVGRDVYYQNSSAIGVLKGNTSCYLSRGWTPPY